jgi:hypothetical protein
VNAVAEATMMADSPATAAPMWTRVPAWMPATDNSPALFPRVAAVVTMYMTAGPGTSSSARATPEKRRRVDSVGIASM